MATNVALFDCDVDHQRKGRSSLEDQKHVEMLLATPLWARFSMESYERMRKRTLGQFIPTKLAAGRRFGGCKLTPMGKPCRRLEMLGQAAEKFMGEMQASSCFHSAKPCDKKASLTTSYVVFSF